MTGADVGRVEITQRRLIYWYNTGVINRRTFIYLWSRHVYGPTVEACGGALSGYGDGLNGSA